MLWASTPRAPQVDEIALLVATCDETHATEASDQRRFQASLYLDETAVVRGTDCSRHSGPLAIMVAVELHLP